MVLHHGRHFADEVDWESLQSSGRRAVDAPMPQTDTQTADSLLELTRALVRTPSRAGEDDYEPILTLIASWLGDHGVVSTLVPGTDGRPVGVTGMLSGPTTRSAWLLNATADTAPFGDPAAWSHGPTSGDVRDGWMYGRGSADSKAGIAVFCHVLRTLAGESSAGDGAIAFLFDVEEHTGTFGGIRAFVERLETPLAGAFIGYPGMDRVVVGARGYLRLRIHVAGEMAHSGSSQPRGVNAVVRAARLALRLQSVSLVERTSPAFPLPPKLTVCEMQGGEGFSTVPDRCQIAVDVRLTPHFDRQAALALLGGELADFDRRDPAPRPTRLEPFDSWPAYRLDENAPAALALSRAAAAILGRPVPVQVVGPSNVGNYLASRGVPATSGFGARYRALHAADECIEVASLLPVYHVYLRAARDVRTAVLAAAISASQRAER
jgi:succinyl-diaminopimelate desuccinylase